MLAPARSEWTWQRRNRCVCFYFPILRLPGDSSWSLGIIGNHPVTAHQSIFSRVAYPSDVFLHYMYRLQVLPCHTGECNTPPHLSKWPLTRLPVDLYTKRSVHMYTGTILLPFPKSSSNRISATSRPPISLYREATPPLLHSTPSLHMNTAYLSLSTERKKKPRTVERSISR